MKMVKLIFVCQLLICSSCNFKSKSNCKPYFEFDKLEHYSIAISPGEEIKLFEIDSLSPEELSLNNVLLQKNPTTLSDTTVLLNLGKLGFAKKSVSPSKFQQINNIFCKREHEDLLESKCIPVYRDILVFRNKDQIVGTAKICFECGFHVIAGAKVNTYDFGQSGDYEKLSKLLY